MAQKNLYIAAAGAIGVIVALAIFSQKQKSSAPAPAQQQAAAQNDQKQSRLQPPLVQEKTETVQKKQRKKRSKRKMTLKRWNSMTAEQQAAYRVKHPKAKLPPQPAPAQ